jgi:hypothetical protein
MSDHFLPCPWCGSSTDIFAVTLDREDREGIPMAMQCDCGAMAPWQYIPANIADKEEIYFPMLIKTWNERIKS